MKAINARSLIPKSCAVLIFRNSVMWQCKHVAYKAFLVDERHAKYGKKVDQIQGAVYRLAER